MDLSERLASKQRILALKEKISALLAPLSATDREDILLELLAVGSSSTEPVTLPRRQAAKNDAPDSNFSELMLAALGESPGLGVAEVATRVYGDDSPATKNRARSLLSFLKRKGMVVNTSSGHWGLSPKVPQEGEI